MIPLRQKFTSKERDTESNLDYFGARYFSGPQGRFSSPDPENRGGIPQDPQSWNAYAYARNNPLLYTDPTGEAYVICDEKGKNCSNPQEFLPRDENVRYNPNGTIDAINGDGSATRVGSYYEVGDYQDATGSLLMFAGLARLAVGGAVALIDRAALAFERNIGRLAGSEAGTLNFGSDSLPIPKVTDKKLANLVRDLFKGTRTKNPIGTGSTADAVRSEIQTGLPVGGKYHSQKATEYIEALDNWLRKNPNASYQDRLVAQSLCDDLASALRGN